MKKIDLTNIPATPLQTRKIAEVVNELLQILADKGIIELEDNDDKTNET